MNAYKELKELDYDLYVKAIQFSAGLIENIKNDSYGKDRDACIEKDIVSFALCNLVAKQGANQ